MGRKTTELRNVRVCCLVSKMKLSMAAFLNPNYSTTRFFPRPIIFEHWTAKNSPLKPILPSSLPPPFQQKIFEDFFWSYVQKTNNLLSKFVSVKQRNTFFCIIFLIPQIRCDPFKILPLPLVGRDPAVEKHCSMHRYVTFL